MPRNSQQHALLYSARQAGQQRKRVIAINAYIGSSMYDATIGYQRILYLILHTLREK